MPEKNPVYAAIVNRLTRRKAKSLFKRVSCFPGICCNSSLFGVDLTVANILFQT